MIPWARRRFEGLLSEAMRLRRRRQKIDLELAALDRQIDDLARRVLAASPDPLPDDTSSSPKSSGRRQLKVV